METSPAAEFETHHCGHRSLLRRPQCGASAGKLIPGLAMQTCPALNAANDAPGPQSALKFGDFLSMTRHGKFCGLAEPSRLAIANWLSLFCRERAILPF